MDAKQRMQEASIAAVVIRADGTREDLGVVSYWHKSRGRRLWWNLRHFLKEVCCHSYGRSQRR
jgi:hypothetical protein